MRANYSEIIALIPWLSISGKVQGDFNISKHAQCEKINDCLATGSHVVLVNGHYRPDLSCLPQGLSAMPMSKARYAYSHFLNEELSRFPNTPFSEINGGEESEGLFLYVHKNDSLFDLEIVNYISDSLAIVAPFICLVIGRDCHVRLKVRTHHADTCYESHLNGKIECFVEERGSCDLQLMANGRIVEEIWTVSTQLKTLSAQNLQIIYDDKASGLKFYDCHTILNGKGSQGEITLRAGLKVRDRLFMNIRMEHVEPETKSNQVIRTILEDSSQIVFCGGIYIHSQAEETQAYQKHDTLLISETASVETRPSLEIFADNVKASHGATIGQFEQSAMYYLRTRGLTRARAFDLLKKAFLEEGEEVHGSKI